MPAAELAAVISKYARALAPGSAFYLSFKLSARGSMRGGRWFADLDEPALRALIAEVPGLGADRVEITGDARPGEKWVNVLCVRGTAARPSARPSIAARGTPVGCRGFAQVKGRKPPHD